MSVANPITRDDREQGLTATAAQTVFGPLNFKIWDILDLVVKIKAPGEDLFAPVTEGFEVSIEASPGFPTVTFDEGLDEGTAVVFSGRRIPERSTDVTLGGVIRSPALERELDKILTVQQEISRDATQAQEDARVATVESLQAQEDSAAATIAADADRVAAEAAAAAAAASESAAEGSASTASTAAGVAVAAAGAATTKAAEAEASASTAISAAGTATAAASTATTKAAEAEASAATATTKASEASASAAGVGTAETDAVAAAAAASASATVAQGAETGALAAQAAAEAARDEAQEIAGGGQPATGITFTPAGNIAATNVQSAIAELDSEKIATSALDTDTALAANSDSKVATQKATKAYADTKIASSFLDTDGTLAGNSDSKVATQKAVKTYADQLIAAADAMVFKGVIDCSSNPNYPAADRGATYRVSVAGKIGGGSGPNVEAGDLLLCLTDSTSSGTHGSVGAAWSIAQTNLDGVVIGPASVTDGVPALFDGTTGKLLKAESFANFKTALALAKADVGLGNVDNTSNATERAAAATLTNKRVTPRIGTTVDSATPTPDGDAHDQYTVTALAQAATFGAPSGTPTDGQKLIVRIKDNGTARALSWNAIYRSLGATLPTTTVISKTLYVGFIYNSADSKWDCVATAQEA